MLVILITWYYQYLSCPTSKQSDHGSKFGENIGAMSQRRGKRVVGWAQKMTLLSAGPPKGFGGVASGNF